MLTNQLIAEVDTELTEDGDQTYLVRSPAVGIADGVPQDGVFLNPLDGFLTLRVLNRRYVIQLPRDIQGRVSECFIDDTRTPVGYRQPLFRLSQSLEVPTDTGELGGAEAGAATGAAAGLIPVTAPSDGVFYRRPSPDAPNYVKEGSEVSSGTVLGLVEVIKSFNQITYGAPGLPESGTVEQILVEDAAEVTYGQPLMQIRPA